MTTASKKYNHAEAFCLMQYQCEKCGISEMLWNSRDGVTPFIIGCTNCDGAMQHVNWREDSCEPDYKPHVSQRIFVDLTEERRTEITKEKVNAWWPSNSGKCHEMFGTKENMLETLLKDESNYRREGEPDIKVVEAVKD